MNMPPQASLTTDEPVRAIARRGRRRWVWLVAVVVVLSLVVVLVWFQPQVLLFDTVIEDEFPAVAGVTDPAVDDPPVTEHPATAGDPAIRSGAGEADGADHDVPDPVAEPVALAAGSFDSRNRYTVTGQATVYELPDSARILRLEGFESTNGPDLFVYLTVGDATEPSDAALVADYVDLGVLRGNVGEQNYVIDPEVDLGRFDTVVIWCRRFSSAFGAADLR